MRVMGFEEASGKWYFITKKNASKNFAFKLAINNPNYNFFISDQSYFYIYNNSNFTIEYVSDSIKNVLGIEAAEFNHYYLISHLERCYDQFLFNNEFTIPNKHYFHLTSDFKQLKISYNLRYIKENGEKIMLLHQMLPFQINKKGDIIRFLVYQTVYYNLYKKDQMVIEFFDKFTDLDVEDVTIGSPKRPKNDFILTMVELQIIFWLAKGMTSRQISIQLRLSEHTIKTHRKNLLKKTKCQSSAELIAYSIKQNWL